MATKRVLYRPVQTNVGKKRNRRPLAQGRLVTSAQPTAPGIRLQQGEINESQASVLSAHSKLEDAVATPRRLVPHVTERHSPLPSPPTHTLDLSDSDDDHNDAEVTFQAQHTPAKTVTQSPGTQAAIHHIPHVMVLDASALSQSPNRADVDCVVGYERSPATVICHNQSSGAKSPRGGDNAVFQVTVEHVPKVIKSPDMGVNSPLAPGTANDGDRTVRAVSPLHANDDIDTMVSRSSRKQNRSAKQKNPVPNLPQPCFDESGESEKTDSENKPGKKKKALPLPTEVTSDSDTCSLFEYVPQMKNRPKTAEGSRNAVPSKSEKRKKGDRIVPSRYMQSALSKQQSENVSAERSVLTKKSLNLGSSNNNSSHGPKSTGKKTASRSQSARPFTNVSSPDRGKVKAPQGKTSTPTHDDVPNMTGCDASAINPELSMLSAIDTSHFRFGSNSGSAHSADFGSRNKQTKKVDLHVQQQCLASSYARYLQWLFLDSKASFVLHQQEKDTMKQLHALWEMMESKRHEKAELERDVARLRHLNMLDEQVERQDHALEPLVRLLSTFHKDYSGLASALDTTRHQIQSRGIHIPEDEEFFLASLEQVLQESEQLLGTLSMMTKKQAPAVKEFSDALQAVEQAVDAVCLELYRCGELQSAVQSLATHENSLRIQAMQTNR